MANGDIESARQLTAALRLADPNSPGACHARGLLELLSGNHQQAVDWLSQAERVTPDDPQLLCNLGSAYLNDGRPTEAEAVLRRALALRPQYQKALFNLGCATLANGDAGAAGELLQGLVDEYPSNPEYHCSRADAARDEGRWHLAISGYRKALEADPDHVRAISNLGALLVCFGNSDEALEFCLRAVTLAPESYLPHLNLGRCLAKLERFEEAMSVFADAYELEPDSAILCTEIAAMWLTSGDLEDASSWY